MMFDQIKLYTDFFLAPFVIFNPVMSERKGIPEDYTRFVWGFEQEQIMQWQNKI